MKIKVLARVKLDFDGVSKIYNPSDTIHEIDDNLAKERNYLERYSLFPKHIEIVEKKKSKPKKKVEEEAE